MTARLVLMRVFSSARPDTDRVQMVRFVLTGGVTAGLDVLLLILLVEHSGMHYLVAGFIAFVVAVTLNYIISRAWVFEPGRFSKSVEFVGFFVTSGAGLGINQMVLWLMVDTMLVDYRFSKLVSIIVVTVWNFATKKFLVFRS